MKTKISYILILLIFIFTMVNYSFAVTQTEINNMKNEVDEMESRQDEIKGEKDQALSEIEELNTKISDSEDELDKLNTQIEELNASITKTEAELKESEEKYEKQQKDLEDRLIAQYVAGKTTYLDVLLGSTSLSNFISRYYLVGQVAKMDQELLDSIEQEKQKIEKAKTQLEQQKVEVKTAKANQEKTNVVLKNAKATKNSQIAKLSEEDQELQRKIDEFNEAIKKGEEQIRRDLQASQGYVGSFSGTLSWPISTSSSRWNMITSGYGMRDQPTAGASSNHKAVDVGVSYVPIYAAADGYIVTASKVSGYGNFIMIKHSNNLYTCYGHLFSFNVSAGQIVSRGQQIAVSGNTGVTTGPHLHFEVRLNGTSASRVNPLNYIPDSVYSKLIFR